MENRDTESKREREAKKKARIFLGTHSRNTHELQLITQEPVKLDVTRPTVADVSGIRPSHFRKIQLKETCSHVKSKQARYQVRKPPQSERTWHKSKRFQESF